MVIWLGRDLVGIFVWDIFYIFLFFIIDLRYKKIFSIGNLNMKVICINFFFVNKICLYLIFIFEVDIIWV